MAKTILSALLLLFASQAFAQSSGADEDIYDAVFNDMTNFRIAGDNEKSRPRDIVVMANTMRWNPKRFWSKELQQVSPALRRTHPIKDSAVYLFRDSLLDVSIADQEKMALALQAKASKSSTIKVKGKNYKTEATPAEASGYYVMATEPLVTRDGVFAFVDMALFQNLGDKTMARTRQVANICAVYRKTPNKWVRLGLHSRLVKAPGVR